MPIHLGKLIQDKAREKKYSQQELGDLINRSKQNVGDIYKRQSIDSELLLKLSEVLEYDFFSVYCEDNNLKSVRKEEVEQLKAENKVLRDLLKQKEEMIANLKIAVEANQKAISFLEEERAVYKKITKVVKK